MSTSIEVIVDEIRKDEFAFSKKDQKVEFYVNKYPDEADKYPMLIKSACDPSFDFEKLQWMMNMLNKVNTKELSQYDASVKVGEELVNEYVKPKLNM
jgi:hypothetical protein